MSTALEKTDPALLEQLTRLIQNSGQSSTYDPQLATSFIKWAAQNTNLISPAMACPSLPLGFELAFTKVEINPDPKFKEVYRQSDGGLSLTKVGLEKIQKGAGIRLDPKLTRKLDNGKDSLFAVYEFVGHYRDFDGTICPLKGTKELDLHDDSAEIAKIRSRQKSQASGDNEINELRRFISGHAESKAKNRGIRSFGVKSSYSDAELQKPFTCIRLIRTGRCEDPTLQRELTLQIHQEYMLAEQSLFGGHSRFESGPELKEIAPSVDQERAALTTGESEAVNTTTEPPLEQVKEEPPSTECTPSKCLKIGSTKHVPECFGETTAKAEPEQVALPKMDAVDRALSSQLDVVVDALDHAEGKTEAEVEALLKEKAEITTAIEARRK